MTLAPRYLKVMTWSLCSLGSPSNRKRLDFLNGRGHVTFLRCRFKSVQESLRRSCSSSDVITISVADYSRFIPFYIPYLSLPRWSRVGSSCLIPIETDIFFKSYSSLLWRCHCRCSVYWWLLQYKASVSGSVGYICEPNSIKCQINEAHKSSFVELTFSAISQSKYCVSRGAVSARNPIASRRCLFRYDCHEEFCDRIRKTWVSTVLRISFDSFFARGYYYVPSYRVSILSKIPIGWRESDFVWVLKILRYIYTDRYTATGRISFDFPWQIKDEEKNTEKSIPILQVGV